MYCFLYFSVEAVRKGKTKLTTMINVLRGEEYIVARLEDSELPCIVFFFTLTFF